jgi:hypothetical protein
MNDAHDRRLTRWSVGIVLATICLSIGLPLVGSRVFFPTDILKTAPPWSEIGPSSKPTNPILGDPLRAFMPMRAEFRRRLDAGDFPLWAPYPGGGAPLGAVPNVGPLAPLNVPYLVLPLWYAPAIAKLLEMLVAAAFMFLFLRQVGLGRASSLVGGLVYMNSGFQAVWTNWPQSHIGALIPALFWGIEWTIHRGRVWQALPVALVTAAMLLEGFPPVTLFALIAAGIYAMVRISSTGGSGRSRIQAFALLGGAVLLGFGLSAFQLIPSARQLGALQTDYRTQTEAAHLPLRALVTLGIPNAFGSPVDGTYYATFHDHPTGYVGNNYTELQSFVGMTALVLLVVAGTRLFRMRTAGGRATGKRPDGPLPPGVWSYLWGGAILCAVLIYVGGPVLGLLQHTPLFHLNYVGRLRSVFGFLLAALAAVGLEFLVIGEGEPSGRERLVRRAVVVLAVVVSALALLYVWRIAGDVGARRYLVAHAMTPLIVGVLAVLAIGFKRRLRLGGQPMAVWIVPVLISIESLAFVLPYWPRTERSLFYPTTPAHRFLAAHLGDDRLAAANLALYPGTTTFYRLRSVTAQSFQDKTWADLVRAVDPASSLTPRFPRLRPTPDVATSPVLDRMGVRYFVTSPDVVPFGLRMEVSAATGTVVLPVGSSLSAPIPDGRIRGVIVRLTRPLPRGGDGGVLTARLVDGSGRVLRTSARRLRGGRRGEVAIPLVETDPPAGAAGTLEVRLSLTSPDGEVTLAADAAGRPAVSVVMAADDGLRLVFATGVAIYERQNALPRIRWAGRAEVVRDPARRLMTLGSPVPSGTVILNGPGPAGSGSEGRVEAVADEGDQIQVRVTAGGEGYVVVADAMQHGWKAFIDTKAARLVPAEHAMVAVFVPRGTHDVTLRYQPASWRQGQLVSGLSVLALLGILLVSKRRSPRKTQTR